MVLVKCETFNSSSQVKRNCKGGASDGHGVAAGRHCQTASDLQMRVRENA